METVSGEFAALLESIHVIIHVLDKKGLIPREEMGDAFSIYAESAEKVDPIITETFQRIASMCRPKKKGSPINLTLISNNDEDTEPDK